ncbi:hypothetical protein GH714_021387 [Hevea brasiliensis]|uniref:F-box protein n=1 Tax=Hevea brasiliensis TaxID=3981 RepID=A0A6A6LTY2_HEVBR|nr:hypothetical protein GH714_021387 [Hevea brasiliensis]
MTSSSNSRRGIIKATINAPKIWITPLPLPKLSSRGLVEELDRRSWYEMATTTSTPMEKDSTSWINNNTSIRQSIDASDPMVIARLYAIMEVVADRVEMHKNIGEQRDNWNNLLLTSINAVTLTAATMCGLAAVNASGAPLVAFKVSSTVLYLAATGMLAIMNSIQPSQLAEEQRNASRLFKQLNAQIHTMLAIGNPTISDVNEAMENVLALDKAYPLPLLGPLLTGLAAMGSAFVGTNPWAVIVGVVGGASASIVNTIEHGGQVGMVFEMYRSTAGFFKLVEETIESNINERDVRTRENGEMLEIKVALQLGRSLSELRNLAASSSSRNGKAAEEFASKLF